MLSPEGNCESSAREGPLDKSFHFICDWRTKIRSSKIHYYIRLFEHPENLYPPKGAAKAVPEWGPIDFTYVLIILSCVLETYLGVSKCALLSAF